MLPIVTVAPADGAEPLKVMIAVSAVGEPASKATPSRVRVEVPLIVDPLGVPIVRTSVALELLPKGVFQSFAIPRTVFPAGSPPLW